MLPRIWLRMLLSLLSTTGSGATGWAATRVVGVTSRSTFSRASNVCCLNMLRSFWAL